jgi:dTDP-4-amino-4,6-dideoxygalactose transaminase
MMIDNACGIDTQVPDWPWQSFSLHQTKPYGLGEGGLVLTPQWAAQELYSLIDYGSAPDQPESWLANGKISDISCAFLLDRLEQSTDWIPLYRKQMARITALAVQCGLTPLSQSMDGAPATSLPFLSEYCIQSDLIEKSRNFSFSKHYRPQQETPNAQNIWSRIINIPTHPDMHALSDEQIISELRNVQRVARMKDRQDQQKWLFAVSSG